MAKATTLQEVRKLFVSSDKQSEQRDRTSRAGGLCMHLKCESSVRVTLPWPLLPL